MTRILSAAVLLPLVLAIVWYLPPLATQLLTGTVTALAFYEYGVLAQRHGAGFPVWASGLTTLAAFVAVTCGYRLEPVLVAGLLLVGTSAVLRGRPEEDVLRRVAVALVPVIYLALPLAMAVSIRTYWGPLALMLPFLTIVVSDSAQYFGGRAFGRTPLAPSVSPKKTVEGAICGVIAGGLFTPIVGVSVFPSAGLALLTLLGLGLVAAGIAGDLFESLLKRSAGVKDSSQLIPGHGGILDRIDALLFAFPVYYLFLWYGFFTGLLR